MVAHHCTVFIILLLATTASSCIQTNNGAPSDSLPNGQPLIEWGMQIIIPRYQFQCCGKVAEWKIRMSNTTERFNNIIELQVWRPRSTCTRFSTRRLRCYSLFGTNTFTNVSSVNGIATLSPLPQEQIQVKPCDVIGLYIYSESLSHGTSVATINTRRAWLAYRATLAYPNTTCFQKNQYRLIQQAPVVTASLASAYSCSRGMQSSSADSPRSNTGIIVGASIAGTLIALLLLIGAIIIALLIVIKRRVTRHFNSPSFLCLQQEQEMASNHCEFSTSYSYVRHFNEKSIATQENQAYKKTASNQDNVYYETYY